MNVAPFLILGQMRAFEDGMRKMGVAAREMSAAMERSLTAFRLSLRPPTQIVKRTGLD